MQAHRLCTTNLAIVAALLAVDPALYSLYDEIVVDPSSIFLLVFLVSLGLTIVLFALGVVDVPGIGHADVDLGHGGHGGDVGHGTDVGGDVGSGGLDAADVSSHHTGASPFNMATILAFATWFSGAGYLLTGPIGLSFLTALVLSLVCGLTGSSIVFFVLTRVLLRGQTPYMRAEDYEPEGTIGRLTTGIRAGGTGELVYSKAGSRRVTSARSAMGAPIPRGTEVVIVRQERGVAYVEPFDQFIGSTDTEAPNGKAKV
jgi:hypothetical protein